MGDWGHIGKAFNDLVVFTMVSLVIAWPLAIWKIIDLLIILSHHVRFQ